MTDRAELLPTKAHLVGITAKSRPEATKGLTLVTQDHEVIRHWADNRQATPATGERSSSGPATVNVTDGGAGIRFNFPAASLFRPISWEEWFQNFDQHHLAFVYDEHMPDGNVSTRHRIVKSELMDRHLSE